MGLAEETGDQGSNRSEGRSPELPWVGGGGWKGVGVTLPRDHPVAGQSRLGSFPRKANNQSVRDTQDGSRNSGFVIQIR